MIKIYYILLKLTQYIGHHSPYFPRKWIILTGLMKVFRINPWQENSHWDLLINRYDKQDIYNINGIFIQTSADENLSIFMMLDYEPYTRKTIALITRAGDVVVDAGANIGFMSLEFAKYVGESGKVISYEPVAETIEKFKKNMTLNEKYSNRISLAKVALGDYNGRATINIPLTSTSSNSELGQSSMVNIRGDRSYKQELIDVVKLDDQDLNSIDILKIDVEGMELSVLKGAENLCKKCRPIFIFELNGASSDDLCSTNDIEEFINEIGTYSYFVINRNINISKSISNLSEYINTGVNILAVPENKLNRLELFCKRK